MIVDLTHQLDPRTPVYPNSGEKAPHFDQQKTVARDGFSSFRMTCDMHTGTHIDAPAHMQEQGKKLSDVPLDYLCANACVINAHNKKIIARDLLHNITAPIVLLYTGFDQHYHDPDYFTNHPIINRDAAEKLIASKIRVLGIDFPSPDKFPFEIHQLLFQHDILIIENLTNLGALIGYNNITVYALPLACATDGAPARVIAEVT